MRRSVIRIAQARDLSVVADQVIIADRFWSRLRGLWGKPSLADHEGLLLVPCSSVHTFGMRFAIAVVAIDRQGMVRAVHAHLPPGRVAWLPRGTHAVLELSAGERNIHIGDRLVALPAEETALPATVLFLSGRDTA